MFRSLYSSTTTSNTFGIASNNFYFYFMFFLCDGFTPPFILNFVSIQRFYFSYNHSKPLNSGHLQQDNILHDHYKFSFPISFLIAKASVLLINKIIFTSSNLFPTK
nr:MAG TPA: hypothetical protein [Caudoviricetes sp.]